MLESTAKNYRYYESLPRDIVQTDNVEKDALFPDDIITYISFFLDNKTLGKSLQINKNWFNTLENGPVYNDRLWERNFYRHFKREISKPIHVNWHDFYIFHEKVESKNGNQQLLDKIKKIFLALIAVFRITSVYLIFADIYKDPKVVLVSVPILIFLHFIILLVRPILVSSVNHDNTVSWYRTFKNLTVCTQEVISEFRGSKLE